LPNGSRAYQRASGAERFTRGEERKFPAERETVSLKEDVCRRGEGCAGKKNPKDLAARRIARKKREGEKKEKKSSARGVGGKDQRNGHDLRTTEARSDEGDQKGGRVQLVEGKGGLVRPPRRGPGKEGADVMNFEAE